MGIRRLILPEGYQNPLDLKQTELAIKLVREIFERELSNNLNLQRVSAPLFVVPESGLNDNLNGTERPVCFDVPFLDGRNVEIVHSLAKWKRMALARYGFEPDSGLYTDMNAIRRDEEELDNIHSMYVDQWDWEKVITRETRNIDTLKETVRAIYRAIYDTEQETIKMFPCLKPQLPKEIQFITTQELEDQYPLLSAKERENKAAETYGAVFLMQIGGALKSGKKHDGRAPDYDDWSLNGDILVYNPILKMAFELSSMGIRVDEETLTRQLAIAGCEDRASLPFHKALLNGELPLTIGGGIGQSRLCMLLLQKAHIGEVHVSVWDDETMQLCEENNMILL
jgi:aspartate--ammonia ligase